MKARTTNFRRGASGALAVGMIFVCRVAEACEGCKQAVGMGDGARGSREVNSIGFAYGLSIMLMLCVLAAVLGGLGLMMRRNCAIIAARQKAALAEDDGEAALGDGAVSVAG